MTRFHIFIALAVGLLFPPHQSNAAEDNSDKSRNTGIVVDTEGRPVPDAEVRTFGDHAPVRTDSAGRFSLQFPFCVAANRLLASDATGARMAIWENVGSMDDAFAQFLDARIVLRPSLQVKAHVVDARGAPVPGARVVATHEIFAIAMEQTDATGLAVLRIPSNTDLRHVLAFKAGAGFDYMENFTRSPYPMADPPPAEVTLTLEGIKKVQVQAIGTDGKPVAGVRLYPWSIKKLGRQGDINPTSTRSTGDLWRTTDASGIATFDYLPLTITGETQFATNPLHYSQQENAIWLPEEDGAAGGASTLVTARVLRSQTISGKVLFPDGKPAPGILLHTEGVGHGSDFGNGLARTRTDGTFTMVGVASEKSYMVGIMHPDWTARSATGVILKEEQARDDLVFHLVKGTLLSGTVTDHDHKPVPDYPVGIVEMGAMVDPTKLVGFEDFDIDQEFLWHDVATDAQGHYSLRLGPGAYRIGTDQPDDDKFPVTHITDQTQMVRDLIVKPMK